MLGRLRIGPKLLLAPGLMLLLLLVCCGAAYYAMVRQNQSLDVIVVQRAARIRAATALVADVQSAHARSYQVLTWISGSFTPVRIAALVADIEARHLAIERRLASLMEGTAPASAERRLLAQSGAAHRAYMRIIADVIELGRSDQSIGASAMIKAEQAFDTVAQRLQALSALEQDLANAAAASAAADFRLMARLMPALVALSVVLALAVTMAVRRALLREVRDISQAAVDLASGRLTVRQRDYGRDEIADSARVLDASIRNLNATLRQIRATARSIDAELGAGPDAPVGLEQMTRSELGAVEQAAAAARRLQEQAQALARAVAGLELDENDTGLPPQERSGRPGLWLASSRDD